MNAFFQESSSESSGEEDEIEFPSAEAGGEDFSGHRRKRRKTRQDAKESAALGIFGSESEDERPHQRWKSRNLRGKGLGFVKSGQGEEEEEDDNAEEDEEDDDQMMEEGLETAELEETAGLQGLGSRGLGFDTPTRGSGDEDNTSMEGPLGRGFVPSSAKRPQLIFAPPSQEASTPQVVRPSFTSPAVSSRRHGAGKVPGQGGVNPNSFAAKMMAKMGYKAGQGLGKEGEGRLEPVEQKLRPQGVGLGAVKEMSEKDKAERKRAAALRGQVVEDSSEEERKRRKNRNKTRTSGGLPTAKSKPKIKYQTAADFEAAADGLQVPNVLKSIIDATGKETKLLTSTSGLMTPQDESVAPDAEALKIARRARRDLEAFVEEWNNLSERKKYNDFQESQLSQALDAQQEEIRQLKEVADAAHELSLLDISGSKITKEFLDARWEEMVSKLETLEFEYKNEIEKYGLSELAVAAIHPLFRASMDIWDPLEEPTYLVARLRRLRKILGMRSNAALSDALEIAPLDSFSNGDYYGHNKSTTYYETMIHNLWLPKIRSVLTNEWDVHDPTPTITLIDTWKDVLPDFVYTHAIDQLIVRKLTAAVGEWNPRLSHKKRYQVPPPHFWLFPWLPYLDEYHTNPANPDGLLADVKRKFRVVIDTWDLAKGVIPGLQNWREVLRGELDNVLIRHLLPRLALLLQTDFEVDPADQDLTALERVLNWQSFFKPSVIGQLLTAEFFPKWHNILHLWLTSEPNYEEVGQWFTWWKGRFPEEVNDVAAVASEWEKGLQMMNRALDLGERAKTELPLPAAGPARPIKESAPKPVQGTPAAAAPAMPEEATFKDVVEAWCSEENLLMMPLREAHAQTGLPLFRITASANGKGGVLVYLKGDVVWAQNKKDKGIWEPMGLEEGLIERAEGK